MALNIKNAEVERLAAEVASLTGETKTEAIRQALAERARRLRAPSDAVRSRRIQQFLNREVWSVVPAALRGTTTTGEDLDEILGYDEHGV